MQEVHVYKMNDYEWWASKWDMHQTNDYCLKEWGLTEDENPLEDIFEVDIDSTGVWCESDDLKDREILSMQRPNKSHDSGEPKIGSLKEIGGMIYKYLSFRQIIEQDGAFEEPYCIGITE